MDNWVSDFGKLEGHSIITLSPSHFSETVADYFSQGDWNIHKLRLVLPWEVIRRILSIHVVNCHSGVDRLIWGLSMDGKFSVKSAYGYKVCNEDAMDWQWHFLWKLKMPPRIRMFMWTVLHEKILTKEHIVARGIMVDTTCSRCKTGCENLIHVFKDCPDAKAIWEDLCLGITSSDMFKMEWHSWLLQNLKNSGKILGVIPAYLLFSATLWFLWKWRCKAMFEPSFRIPGSAGKIILNFVEDWLKVNYETKNNKGMDRQLIAWIPPEVDWVKLNVDGSWSADTGGISAGGLIRNHLQGWICGFAVNRGVGSILEAELWGIFEGLQLVWSRGFKKVLVETDSKSAVMLLSNPTDEFHPLFNIVQSCKSLLNFDWDCSIEHVYRERNRAADGLAKMGQDLSLGLTVFDAPPPQISVILKDDLEGLAFARLVSSL